MYLLHRVVEHQCSGRLVRPDSTFKKIAIERAPTYILSIAFISALRTIYCSHDGTRRLSVESPLFDSLAFHSVASDCVW